MQRRVPSDWSLQYAELFDPARLSGAQRSWSVIGEVESQAGDVIMVNPGEMHDGAPIGGARGWRIMYLDTALVAREVANESAGIRSR
jgi:hypothetical protein